MHNPKSVEFHQCRAKRHSICFYHSIKDNERNLYQDLLTTENTDSDIMQMSYLYRQVQNAAHRSQVPGHRSQVAGRRSQVTENLTKKLDI